jgi:RNA polymerase sigma-70 factor (ECF subfamily)
MPGGAGLSADPGSDELLLLAAGKGDLGAFEEIVRRHQAWGWRTAYRFLGHKEEAEDVVQDAFLKMLGAAPRYRPQARFRTYLYTILTRLCIDRQRKRHPEPVEGFPDLADPASGPAEDYAEKERRALVRKALDALPPNQKAAIILRHFDELSYGEIAEILGVTVKAVENLLGRARMTLRSVLARPMREN